MRAKLPRFALVAAVAGFVVLSACGPSPDASGTRAVVDGWHEFEGAWNATGRRQVLQFGGDRRAALIDLGGTVLLAGRARPGVGFRGELIALNDTNTGLVGRAAWTDERGDQVFSELSGQGVSSGNKAQATIIGGTGRYAGATGSYDFTWQYVLEAEDGKVQGRTEGLKGRIRLGPGPAAQAAPKR